jgi:ABC-type multidrug transport system fused ATPase/permease subunit
LKGSGKSSLLAALFRFVKLNNGYIYIDKNNIKNISLNKLRKNITIIPQGKKIKNLNLK